MLSPNKRYPQIKINGRNVMVHRAAYQAYVGDIPHGVETLSDNMKDMWSKNRHVDPKQAVPFEQLAKMSETMTQKQISAEPGLSRTAVSYALCKLGRGRWRGMKFEAAV